MDARLDHARGALWGQAVGDALGTTQEFTHNFKARPFPELNPGPQKDIVGQGPFHLEPGQITDDTQMAVCLASSLKTLGRFDGQDVAARYVAWAKVAFDIGYMTRTSLGKINQGAAPIDAGYEVWEQMNRDVAPNGSLMRSSPIPVFFRDDPAALRRAAMHDSALTHADPRCQLACAAYGAAIRLALIESNVTPEAMRKAAIAELPEAAKVMDARVPAQQSRDAVAALLEDLEMASHQDPEMDVYKHAGFVRIAFRLAFWELMHAPTFETALLDVVNRGGDSDTNGAITGALYGSLAGESVIPERWRSRVESACRGPNWSKSPLGGEYHPMKLFEVIRSASPGVSV